MLAALARLLPYLGRVRRSLVLGLACILVATALSLTSPWLLKLAIDGLLAGDDRIRLGLLAAGIVGLAAADGVFRYLMRTLLIGASRQMEYDLRQDFFAHLQRLPPAYFQAHRTGDLMSRATNDLAAVRMMSGPALMYFVSTALGFVVAVGVMCWIDWRLTLIVLLPLPGVTLGTRYFGRAIHDRFERIQAQLSDMSAVVQEALAGVRVVRAYRREPFQVETFARSNDEYVARNRGLIRLQGAFYPTLTFCFGLSGLLMLWFGGRAVMSDRMTLGDFVAFSRYLVLLSWPLIAFGWVINLVQRGLASWKRMLEVFDTPPAEAVDMASAPGVPCEGPCRIEACGLTFTYPGASAPALTDVSFVVEPGQTLAIVGPTGSGKSTLVHLLLRLREPDRGMLFLDGTDVRDLPLATVRSTMALVAQEPFLFSDTIGGNIVFGTENEWGAPEVRAQAAEAAARAGLADDVTGFPHGYDTVIGERGITLSGGQKQRLALARAILADRPILILDDALSAVDTATEHRILEQLRQVRASRSCIIVAHRISTVRDADQILVLDHGRVVERGTHESLVEADGLYADMHRRQQLEEELARVS
ncbi:MAG: ABC transporter ATP-binding protein [Acidobacteriota bacterium]|jgi:ATP-binding cassette subfamily B multidrug efflux pump|nr:MAG: ABC transporter ATP-binding protein [Acidobacteriota bacterium]